MPSSAPTAVIDLNEMSICTKRELDDIDQETHQGRQDNTQMYLHYVNVLEFLFPGSFSGDASAAMACSE
jgi:hypothetical protein